MIEKFVPKAFKFASSSVRIQAGPIPADTLGARVLPESTQELKTDKLEGQGLQTVLINITMEVLTHTYEKLRPKYHTSTELSSLTSIGIKSALIHNSQALIKHITPPDLYIQLLLK